jgi:hypothetical protein
MAFKESQRRVVEQRTQQNIQQAGAGAQAGINQFMGGGLLGMQQAPEIAQILAALQGPTSQDVGLAQQATFGGITQGMMPQIQQALQAMREGAASSGISNSTISAAGQAQVLPQLLAPALGQAQRNYAGLLTQLPFQRAQALSGVRGQAHTQLAAALERDLSERSRNVTSTSKTTERTYKKSQPLWKKILGGGLGMLAGGFLGPLGGMVAGKLAGGLLGGGGDSGGGMPLTQQFPTPSFTAGSTYGVGGVSGARPISPQFQQGFFPT